MEQQRIYGLRAIIEAIESGEEISKLYLLKGSEGVLFKQLERLAQTNNVTTSYVPVEKINYLAKGNHQGAVAILSAIDFYDLEELLENQSDKETLTYLLLDGVTDVRNFGAILRTADCTGVDAVIISERGSAPVNAAAIKTSAGAAFSIPICRVNHLKDAVYLLQAYHIETIGANEKASQTFYDIEIPAKIAVVMGSEDRGINPSTLKTLDMTAKLPIKGSVESLNVSVACGVLLYEVVRQREYNKTK